MMSEPLARIGLSIIYSQRTEVMETAVRSRNQEMTNNMAYIKRRHPRVDVHGYVGDIADGNFVLGGIVEDVSSGGFKLSNLPETFSAADRSYTTVISGKGNHYRVIVIPCWTKKTGSNPSLEVGFKIVQSSWEWAEFVLKSSSNTGDDFNFKA
jgi:hypothetical protein